MTKLAGNLIYCSDGSLGAPHSAPLTTLLLVLASFLVVSEHCNGKKAQLATLHWLATFVSKCACVAVARVALMQPCVTVMFASSLATLGTTIRLAYSITRRPIGWPQHRSRQIPRVCHSARAPPVDGELELANSDGTPNCKLILL